MPEKLPVVAIVGRVNVGKSTLFNRLIRKRVAVVGETPGITRDRLEHPVEWRGKRFLLVDTGGKEGSPEDPFRQQIEAQVELAAREAEAIIFLVDGKAGPNPFEEEIALFLRQLGKPVVLAVNKIDSPREEAAAYEFSALGLGEPLPISALHGLNIDALLEAVTRFLPAAGKEAPAPGIKVAIVGRPNVGKSSLLNALCGEERVIVSEVPGTTRDAVDTCLTSGGETYLLIDTAGLRRKKNLARPDLYGMLRSMRAIKRADIVLLVLDASQEVTRQDKRIAALVKEAGKGIILVANKADLLRTKKEREAYLAYLKGEMAFVAYAPQLLVSALKKEGTQHIFPVVKQVYGEASRWLPPEELRLFFKELQRQNPPPRPVKSFSARQVGVLPPTFLLRARGGELPVPYQRYLENQLRRSFGFEGTPLVFIQKT